MAAPHQIIKERICSMKRLNLVLLFVLILLISVTVQAQEETTLLMTFMPNIQFAPAYVGIEAGFFEEAGFDVTLDYLDEPVIVDLVATSEYEFAVVSGEQVILSASESRPVVYVYEWFQQYPVGIVYSSELEVENMADLTNMRVGIPGRFGANYIALAAFLTASGMNETDIGVEEIGFAAPEVFCLGAVDAAVVYVNNEPLQIRNRIAAGDCGDVTDISVLPISSTIDLVSNGLITNQDSVDNNTEMVAAFVGAFNQALALTVNNPARAYLLSAAHIEGLPLEDEFRTSLEALAEQQDEFLATNPEREAVAESRLAMYESLAGEFDADTLLQFEILLASIDLWDAEQLGFTDAQSWVNMQETLLALGHLSDPVELETLYTNEFLPDSEAE
jgi:NitT/TauT family transport system substrate-binding protein